jgi:hypothetical protein
MMTIKRLTVLMATLILLAGNSLAAIPLFQNFGTLTNVPQIDATAFANHGLFQVFSTLPFDTQNTLNFTNTGLMQGFPGFRFDYVSTARLRRPAANFLNSFDARIDAVGGGQFIPTFGTTGGLTVGTGLENAQILVSATNIINRGRLTVDPSGLIRLDGQNVNLERSSVGVLPFIGGLGSASPTNFIPDVGILDLYWGLNVDGSVAFGPNGLVRTNRGSTNFTVRTPPHRVTNAIGGFVTSLTLTNGVGFTFTNAITSSNWVVQAAFIQTSDPDLKVDVKFAPSPILTNVFKTIAVEFSKLETNVLDGGNFVTHVYLLDRLASDTNYFSLTNLVRGNTRRPANYDITRVTPPEFVAGVSGNSTNPAPAIHNNSYSNAIVTNIYSAYGFTVTNVAANLPNIPGVSITNMPGRVEIDADNLNMARARLRGEGLVSVKTRNLLSTSNTVVDVQNLTYDLTSPSGNLLIKGLAKDTIERVAGDCFVWSGMWTNQTGMLVTNTIPDPNNPGGMTNEVVTNVIDIAIHVLVVDASRVFTEQPVFVHDLKARSTNVVIGDTLRLVNTIRVEAENLTVITNAQFLFGGGIPDWKAGNFVGLKNFVNDGTVFLPGSAQIGSDRPESYASIANHGDFLAFNASFRTLYFENTGSIQVDTGFPPFLPGAGTIVIEAGTARLEDGSFDAGADIQIGVNDLKMRNHKITTGQSFILTATNSVADSGEPTNNIIRSEGFHLFRKPALGDLLGTSFESTAPIFLSIPHTWTGEDRGPKPAGFQNNAAIGRLVLKGAFDSQFLFRGTNGPKALYVDFLELGTNVVGDIENAIRIEPSLVIYFADANVSVDRLNGLFPDVFAPQGRLRWVSEFAGPNSSVDVVSRAQNNTIRVNRALRESTTIDSDGDGIVNNLDAFPFDPDVRGAGVAMAGVTFNKQSSTVSFSWDADPGATYAIEYSTDLSSPNWKPMSEYTNTSKAPRRAEFQDKISPGSPQRYYRIRPR